MSKRWHAPMVRRRVSQNRLQLGNSLKYFSDAVTAAVHWHLPSNGMKITSNSNVMGIELSTPASASSPTHVRDTMRANVFHGPNEISVEEVPRPQAGIGEAVIRITLTTICGTDLHILRGEYPVKPGLVIGHEPVGVIEELGDGVSGYEIGERVLVGAITPCGQCRACLSAQWAQCGHGEGVEAIGGWRFGNTINGAQAEYC